MKVIVVLCFALAAVHAQQELEGGAPEFEIAQDEAGEQYLMVPLKRSRR